MGRKTQISAQISETTKRLLDDYTRESGIKKGCLVEDALLHHLQALHELPADIVIPARIVIDRPSGGRVARRLAARARPKKPLVRLMAAHAD